MPGRKGYKNNCSSKRSCSGRGTDRGTSQVSSQQKRRKKKVAEETTDIPFFKITSPETFQQHFPDYHIVSDSLELSKWNLDDIAAASKLRDFVRSYAQEWLEAMLVLPNRNNESSLYPFLFQIFKNVALLNNNIVLDSKFVINEPDVDDVLMV